MITERRPLRPAVPQRGSRLHRIWTALRLRARRRYFLLRALRRRRHLTADRDRTAAIQPGDILAFTTLRNEAHRLPWFLQHYRSLGVSHFLVVDNGSTDGSTELLRAQPDVSLWRTERSYKGARFGMDWMNRLLQRYGHGHWCLTVDADELLIYPHWETRPLPALTGWLDAHDLPALGTMMLELYPKGPLGATRYEPGTDPLRILEWFDSGNHVMRVQMPMEYLWIQGGPRARYFFADSPRRAPTLGKVPLVKWHWRYTYVSSTHTLLPRRLHRMADECGGERLSGVLLHTKFLDSIIEKSLEEKERRQHFANSSLYDDYYEALAQAPELWCPASTRYQGWRQLESLGLMSRGGWV